MNELRLHGDFPYAYYILPGLRFSSRCVSVIAGKSGHQPAATPEMIVMVQWLMSLN